MPNLSIKAASETRQKKKQNEKPFRIDKEENPFYTRWENHLRDTKQAKE